MKPQQGDSKVNEVLLRALLNTINTTNQVEK